MQCFRIFIKLGFNNDTNRPKNLHKKACLLTIITHSLTWYIYTETVHPIHELLLPNCWVAKVSLSKFSIPGCHANASIPREVASIQRTAAAVSCLQLSQLGVYWLAMADSFPVGRWVTWYGSGGVTHSTGWYSLHVSSPATPLASSNVPPASVRSLQHTNQADLYQLLFFQKIAVLCESSLFLGRFSPAGANTAHSSTNQIAAWTCGSTSIT